MTRSESGKLAKKEGHKFEHMVAHHLGDGWCVDGRSSTKVDVYGGAGKYLSIKNPKGKNTQISLTTQDKFIKSFNIPLDLQPFIRDFFGGSHLSEYDRHRKTYSQIDVDLSSKFIDYLNKNNRKLFEYIFTKGFEMDGFVNYMCWASKKNDVNSIFYVDLEKFYNRFKMGTWKFNETTLVFYIGNAKILHLQMKGSGTKYSTGYHSLQFHIHNNFEDTDKQYKL